MKKTILPILAATLFLAACSSKKTDTLDTENKIVFTDTSALNNANASTDIGTRDTTPLVVAEKPVAQSNPQVRTITKVVKVYERQPARKVVQNETTQTDSDPIPTSTTSGSTTGSGIPGTGTSDGTTTVPEKKNTGWSQAAKKATIGGVGGAVIGGVIGKGAKGAAIGGVIGAAGGYILGRKQDRKSGRVDTSRRN